MLAADTHVHVYPQHEAGAVLGRGFANLRRLMGRPASFDAALLLTERSDDRFFDSLRAGPPPGSYRVKKLADPEVLFISHERTDTRLYLFAGRQVVTAEGLEILALVCGAAIADGQPAADTLESIRAAGGIPVVSWAPGKWTGRRGGVVRAMLEAHGNEPLLLGDTAMRALGLPEPRLMRMGRKRRIPVVAGTDPLPLPGEETITGTYGIRSDAFDPARPAATMRGLLQRGDFSIAGHRNTLPVAMRRWLAHRRNNRAT